MTSKPLSSPQGLAVTSTLPWKRTQPWWRALPVFVPQHKMVPLGDPHLTTEGCLPFSFLLQVFEHLLCATCWARCWSIRWISPGSPGDPALVEETDSSPRSRAAPLPVFVNKILLTHSHTHSCSLIWDCFPATMGELSSWDRECMAHNAENIYPGSLRLRGFVPTMA